MRINYLVQDTALFGGVKVVLHHAELLRRAGHEVTIVSPAGRPDWYSVESLFVQVPELDAASVRPAELHIATFWTTVEVALAVPSGIAAHYCQGFEAGLDHNRDEHPKILEAYANRMPTFAVSPHLAELNRDRFGRPVRVVPPALEPFWCPTRRTGPASRPRVVVPHPFEFYMKGVDTALGAVRALRERGVDLELVRISQWPLSEAERAVAEPDEFHHHIRPNEVAELLAGCDLMLAPSWESEGFGLAVLEAMACGLPVVASEIPSHSGFAAGAAELVPAKDVTGLADAARSVLSNPERWLEMRRRGLEVARGFAEDVVVDVVDHAVHWAASGVWRRDG